MKHIQLLLILLTSFVFAQNESTNQGFFLEDWEPKSVTVPKNYDNVSKPTDPIDITISINFSDTVTKVSKYNFGNNTNTYSTRMWDNPGLVTDLTNLNPHVLRYPGGNLSNEFFWDRRPGNKPSDIPPGQNVWYGQDPATWTMSVDNYYILLDQIEATGIICVNYSYARYGTCADPVAQAAHYAAEWVRYDDGRTKFWEIGNENFGNWQAGYEIDTSLNQDGQPKIISGELYGQHALIFMDSMKAAADEIDVDIYIGFQAWESETSWDPVQTNWNEEMMPVVGENPDFYIVHNYYTPFNECSNAATILNSYKKAEDFKSAIYKDLSEFGLSEKPLALTEYNIFAVNSYQPVSHINGLHAALVTGNVIKNQYGLTTRWDLANGWADGNDHGMFARNEPEVEDFTPHPDFYHLFYFQEYFGDVMVESDQEKNGIVVYASSFESGQAGLAIINKGSSAKIVELLLDNFLIGDRYYWHLLQDENGDGSFSRKVFVNDQGPAQVAGGPDNYESIPPFSTSTNDGIIIDSPPYSAIYMMIDGNGIAGVENKSDVNIVNHFELNQNYPNPFNPVTKIAYYLTKSSWVTINIYNVLGQNVATLASKKHTAGNYIVEWDGSGFASGLYICRMEADDGFVQSRKLILLK